MEDLTADWCVAELVDQRYCTVKWEVAAKANIPDCSCRGIDKVLRVDAQHPRAQLCASWLRDKALQLAIASHFSLPFLLLFRHTAK